MNGVLHPLHLYWYYRSEHNPVDVLDLLLNIETIFSEVETNLRLILPLNLKIKILKSLKPSEKSIVKVKPKLIFDLSWSNTSGI